MGTNINNIINYFSDISVKNAANTENKRKLYLTYCTTLLFCLMLITLLIFNYYSKNHIYTKACALLLCLNLTVILTQFITKSYKPANYILAFSIYNTCIFLIHKGGVENLGSLWIIILIPILIFILGLKLGTVTVLLIFISSIIMIFYPENKLLDTTYSFNFKFRFLFSFLGITIFSILEENSREKLNANLIEKKLSLEKTLKQVKELKGLIPICANCKKIRNDKGYWDEVEFYIQQHSKANFTHGVCPKCIKEIYQKK